MSKLYGELSSDSGAGVNTRAGHKRIASTLKTHQEAITTYLFVEEGHGGKYTVQYRVTRSSIPGGKEREVVSGTLRP